MSNLKNRIRSFKYAFQGIRVLFRGTPNAWVHFALALGAILLGIFLGVSRVEWIALTIVIGLVFAMEAINTALETLADYACRNEIHPAIRNAKDLAAAGVLIVAMVAVVVGFLIFIPKIF